MKGGREGGKELLRLPVVVSKGVQKDVRLYRGDESCAERFYAVKEASEKGGTDREKEDGRQGG